VGNIAKEGVQNTHHWSGVWTNWNSSWERSSSAGSCRHSVAIRHWRTSSVMRVLYTLCSNIPTYAAIDGIQIWRIWRP